MKSSRSKYASRIAQLPDNLGWATSYLWQYILEKRDLPKPFHLIIALADHFEPYIIPESPRVFLPHSQQIARVRNWCQQYPRVFHSFVDSSGGPFRHTYFYAAEHSDPELLSILRDHCRQGWGEIEIHLHHGVDAPDTADNTRKLIADFRDFLASIGCLSRVEGSALPRYAFVHGNWALANSAGGRFCGVDTEMQILSETGCYADFTLPSAPGRAQISKINFLYECTKPLSQRAPHRYGRNLRSGVPPTVFPIIVQGPLMLDFSKQRGKWFPSVENSALTARNPPTFRRCQLWSRLAITVEGRPDWVFVKLHCHGMDPRDTDALLGKPMLDFLQALAAAEERNEFFTHFVTAREMTNIILAACRGKSGNPGDFRDFAFTVAS
jgi:hypothetical protein